MLDRGTKLHDRYKIVRLLDQSDFGHLYLARDGFIRQVEIKVITRDAPDIAQRFSTEVELLASTRQPALPIVIEHFVDDIGCCLVTEYTRSISLEAFRIRRYPLHLSEAAALALTMCVLDGLESLHAVGLFHRDIRPANIRLTPNGRVVLTNLGIASQGDARHGSLFGVTTPGFSPVEQRFGETNVRTDLYALGATLYTILSGITPSPADRRVEGDGDPLAPLTKLRPDISQPFAEAVQRLLKVKPRDRYSDVAALRADLVAMSPTIATPDTLHSELKQLRPYTFRSHHLPLLAASTILLLTLIIAISFFTGWYILPINLSTVNGISPTHASHPIPGTAKPSTTIFLPPIDASTPPPRTTALVPVITMIPSIAAINTPAIAVPVITATPPDSIATLVTLPTLPPTPQIANIEPQAVFVGPLPLVLMLQGTGLDQVRVVRLMADSRMPIDTSLQPIDTGQLALSIAALPEPLNGEIQYQLEVDGILLIAPTVSLRDFIERKTMQGILAEYVYTDRVTSDMVSAYTQMRVDPNEGSSPIGLLRNNDEIEILRDDVGGWYQVRVRSSADPAQIGTTGWVERWLVNNQGVPPIPPTATPDMPPTSAPLLFAGRVYSAPTDAAVQCGTTFESSIYGSVEDASGRGISGAQLQIISNDGRNRYTVTTSRGGVYSVPGLGCTLWNVFLIGVPNAPNGFDATVVTVSNLNGGRYTSAEVRFRQQP